MITVIHCFSTFFSIINPLRNIFRYYFPNHFPPPFTKCYYNIPDFFTFKTHFPPLGGDSAPGNIRVTGNRSSLMELKDGMDIFSKTKIGHGWLTACDMYLQPAPLYMPRMHRSGIQEITVKVVPLIITLSNTLTIFSSCHCNL